jgi:hypothetical protein
VPIALDAVGDVQVSFNLKGHIGQAAGEETRFAYAPPAVTQASLRRLAITERKAS